MGIQSSKEPLDMMFTGCHLNFDIFGVVAEFEMEIIHERTLDGLGSTRVRTSHKSRPRGLNKSKAKLARKLKDEGECSVGETYSIPEFGRSSYTRTSERIVR